MSLFWKIFVSFGLAMTVTLVAVVLVSFRLAEGAVDQNNFRDRREIIRDAAAALESGGENALKEWLRNRPRTAPTLLLVFDSNGQELLGRRPASGFIRRAIEQAQDGSPVPRNFLPRRLTPRLVGPDGNVYHLFFARPPPAVFGVLNWPSTQIAVLAIAIAVAALTALLLARYLSAPIAQLQRASRELAAGNLATRVGRPSSLRRDEVGTLAKDFDTMAEQIQALITAKETLLRDVSHELRSPLARIRVALALAERSAGPNAKAHLDRIELESERLDHLVGQIMTLTRLRSQLDVRDEPVFLESLLEEIVDNARFEHPDRDLTFSASTPGATRGDAGELRSAFENVVRNALAYTADDGPVRVNLDATATAFEVRVSDSGPGVAEEDLRKIFEPFYRADASRDHRHSGEGIGLAIAASVMQRHGGHVVARNRAEGGLELILSLPLGKPVGD